MQEEIPSVYFSDELEDEFRAYSPNAAFAYRDLFKFSPKMFENTQLIDSGFRIAKNTISLTLWARNARSSK